MPFFNYIFRGGVNKKSTSFWRTKIPWDFVDDQGLRHWFLYKKTLPKQPSPNKLRGGHLKKFLFFMIPSHGLSVSFFRTYFHGLVGIVGMCVADDDATFVDIIVSIIADILNTPYV